MLLSRRQKRADCRGYEASRLKGHVLGLGRLGLLLLAAALSLMPSGLLLVSRMLVEPQALRDLATGASTELNPAAESLPSTLSDAGPSHGSARVALPQLQIAPAIINVAMASDEDQPIGLMAVINSTITHGTSPGLLST